MWTPGLLGFLAQSSDAMITIVAHFAKWYSITITNAYGKQFRERKDLFWHVVSVVVAHGFWLCDFYTLMRPSYTTEGHMVNRAVDLLTAGDRVESKEGLRSALKRQMSQDGIFLLQASLATVPPLSNAIFKDRLHQ